MRRALNDRQRLMAYLLNKDPDFNYPTRKIAELFGVSQSTISNAVKEVQMARKIQDLEQQLAEVKAQVQDKYVATGKLPAFKIIDL